MLVIEPSQCGITKLKLRVDDFTNDQMSETSFLLLNAATTHISRLKLLVIRSIGTLNFVLSNYTSLHIYSQFQTFTYRSYSLFFRTVLTKAFTSITISSFFAMVQDPVVVAMLGAYPTYVVSSSRTTRPNIIHFPMMPIYRGCFGKASNVPQGSMWSSRFWGQTTNMHLTFLNRNYAHRATLGCTSV